jgi:hypothetical protein
MLAAGSVVAQENSISSSLTSATAEAVSITDQAERAIDERIIDRFVSFDLSDRGRSDRYSVSFDLEHEASDWNFEVTVTMEF